MQIVSFVIWTLPDGLPSTSNFVVHVNRLDASEITYCSIYLNSIAIVFQECRALQKMTFVDGQINLTRSITFLRPAMTAQGLSCAPRLFVPNIMTTLVGFSFDHSGDARRQSTFCVLSPATPKFTTLIRRNILLSQPSAKESPSNIRSTSLLTTE